MVEGDRLTFAFAAAADRAGALTDIVIRRTGQGEAGPPKEAALNRSAEIAGAELGWDEERIAVEIDAVRAFYTVA